MKKLTNAKKRRLQRGFAIVTASFAAALAIISIVVRIIQFVNPGEDEYIAVKEFDYSQYNVQTPDIKRMLLTRNENSRPGIGIGKVNGIVIHYTANPGTDAEANRNYFESRKDQPDVSTNKVSSHYIIGLDGTIIQCIPLNEIAYASNNRNVDTVSIECCHPDKTGKFSKDTYNSLVKLAAWLCSRYELNKDSIIRHYDVSGKECPLYYVNNNKAWNKLKQDIWDYLLESKKE